MSDYINLIITLLAFIAYAYFKGGKGLENVDESEGNMKTSHKGRWIPEEDEDVNDTLEEFLKSFKKESIPPKPPVIQQAPRPVEKPVIVRETSKDASLSSLENYRLQSSIESRKLKSSIESRQLSSAISNRRISGQLTGDVIAGAIDQARINEPSRGVHALNNLPHLRDMVIYDAILNRPEGW